MVSSDPMRSGARVEWKTLIAAVVLVFAVAVAARFFDYGPWQDPAMSVDGEYIMATHDAYHWLAGAVGVGAAVGTPMSELLSWCSSTFGVPLGVVAFWAPAVAAGGTAVAVCLWGLTLGGVEAGFLAGLLSVLGGGFFFRTRLGFYDTDIVTLFFPVFIGWVLAHWMAPHLDRERLKVLARRVLRRGGEQEQAGTKRARKGGKAARAGARKGGADGSASAPADAAAPAAPDAAKDAAKDAGLFPAGSPGLWFLGAPVLAGLLAWNAGIWHGQLLNYAKLLVPLVLMLVLVFGKPGRRMALLWGGCLYAMAAFLHWPGLVLALLVAASFHFQPQRAGRIAASKILLGLFVLVLLERTGLLSTVYTQVINSMDTYLRQSSQLVTTGAGQHGVAFPSIVQSVIEAQLYPFQEVVNKIHPWVGVVLLGLVGFLAVCLARVEAVLLLPLGVLALASVRLGIRMTMFGGPCFALGLGIPVAWTVRRLLARRGELRARAMSWGVQIALLLVLVQPYAEVYPRLPIAGVLSKQHCEALVKLRDTSPLDSMVWTWWDWGFATQYYARRMSFADGARHTGQYVFPLGMALATPNPLQASQIIKYLALNDYNLVGAWQDRTQDEVVQMLLSMGAKDYGLKPRNKQYLVVSYENLRLIYWITYYGSWDLATNRGTHPRVSMLQGQVKLNGETGELVADSLGPKPLRVGSVDILDEKGGMGKGYPGNPQDIHLILNRATGEHHVMDSLAYHSMLVQLLLCPPNDPRFTQYFKLVEDRYPYVRVYEVL
ncbi:MAG: hypothetical protein H0S85_03880 [Desulfovibrionaceae bacterium]|nr:hypothetical protein [Desulfovibrionaceae bacterium]